MVARRAAIERQKSVKKPAPKRARSVQVEVPPDPGILEEARRVLLHEAEAVRLAADRINGDFQAAAQVIAACHGHLVVTGMGKANFVAQKISATFASTGTPSFFLHPADALHGDLGRITSADVVLALSHSGETEEILRLIGPVRTLGAQVLAITASKSCTLAKQAELTLEMGRWEEAGAGLAPTTSTTVMLALGDALAVVVQKLRGFTEEEFHRFHPAGALGRKLMRVGGIMRAGSMVPVVDERTKLSDVIGVMTATPGRPGAALVVDKKKRLVGLFTDGDLRRLAQEGALSLSVEVRAVMSRDPKTVGKEELVSTAAEVLRAFHVDQVPVVDEHHRPIGLLDVQDLLAQRFL
jgi:arabinose-5-phosphate isomerase